MNIEVSAAGDGRCWLPVSRAAERRAFARIVQGAMKEKSLYRLFVDEVGNHDMKHCRSSNERFLTLFGVIVQDGPAYQQIEAEMRDLKRTYFAGVPSTSLIFHRTDVAGMKGQFKSMKAWDRARHDEFNDALVQAYERWQYTAIAVTIDKKAHLDKYRHHHREPYLYCMTVLLERYISFLRKCDGRGDVMFEARDRRLDDDLKRGFRGLHSIGTKPISAATWQKHLPSAKLNVVSKLAGVAGLQLADMLAHSAHYDVLTESGLAERQSRFGARVSQVLRNGKYDRKWDGTLKGYGMKLLP